MGLQFLHTALLWGLGLAALPILIHLLKRRRLKVFRLPTYEFLMQTHRRVARRSQLKNLLLLLLRISAVALVVFLAARPLFLREGFSAGGSWSPLHLVLVIDNSASMRYRTPAGTRFALAVRAAERMVRGLSDADRATILSTVDVSGPAWRRPGGRPAGAPGGGGWGAEEPPLEKKAALARLAALGQTDAAGRPDRALRRALSALGHQADRRSIVVLSDFSRSDWERVSLREIRLLAPDVRIHLVRVAPESGAENVAIDNVRVVPWPPRSGEPFTAVVSLENRGRQKRVDMPVTLRLGEGKAGAAKLDLDPGAKGAVSFRVKAPRGALLQGRVELNEEYSPVTRRFFFTAQMDQRVRIVVVDGDPGAGLVDGESFYVVNALRAARPGQVSSLRVQVVADYQLESVKWEDFDLAVACNVGHWPAKASAALRRFVESGGGLFFAGGELASGTLPGLDWLPAEFGAAEIRNPPQGADIPSAGANHPVFSSLGANPANLFQKVRTRKSYRLRPARNGRAVLTLADGNPVLIVGSVGRGKVAVWGATCDRDWTDMAVRPVFLPFLRGLTDYLSRRGRTGKSERIQAGAPIPVALGAGRKGPPLRVRTPSGREESLPPWLGRKRGGGPAGGVVHFTATHEAGVYEVRGPSGVERVAVNVPWKEGALEPMSGAALRQRLAGADVSVRALKAGDAEASNYYESRMDLGIFLFLTLAAVLATEGFLADWA